jgi:guanylate kinase
MKNVLMVVSGPSGVGKGTLVKTLCKKRDDLVESVSCTTRAPRTGEINGREYYFISATEFSEMVEQGEFLEYDEHFGNFYGTPKKFVKEQLEKTSVVLEIDVVGGLNAKKAFPDCTLVMIAPPSIDVLMQRLSGRNTETQEEIENRLARLEYELSKKDEYDYVVVNDKLELALKELEEIFEREKNKE